MRIELEVQEMTMNEKLTMIGLKHIFIRMKSSLNYFAMKMIPLNILQILAIYYFVLHIVIISRNDTFLY